MAAPTFASALSVHPTSGSAESEVLEALQSTLGGATPDLLVVFVTHHHGAALEGLGRRLRGATGARHLIGCTAEAVIGPSREAEGEPGLSILAACLPATELRAFRAVTVADSDGDLEIDGGPTILDPSLASALVFGEPFSFAAELFLERFDRDWPGVTAVGAMASGGHGPGQNLLLLDDEVYGDGAVGLALEGPHEIAPVVSQGCRPVGEPWVVTKVVENRILELAGRSALDVLSETLTQIPDGDRELLQQGPFLGLAVDARKESFERGDFLARGVLGVARGDRSVVVADEPRRGQTVQFLVRDAASATEDLRSLLAEEAEHFEADSTGALLLTCNGRGSQLFAEPHHDSLWLARELSTDLPVAGLFAMGEIGPIDGHNFLHAFTASVGLIRTRRT